MARSQGLRSRSFAYRATAWYNAVVGIGGGAGVNIYKEKSNMSLRFVAVKPNTNPKHLIGIFPNRAPFFEHIRNRYDSDRRRALVVNFTMRTVEGKWLPIGTTECVYPDRPNDRTMVFHVNDEVTVDQMLDVLNGVRSNIWNAMVYGNNDDWTIAESAIQTLA